MSNFLICLVSVGIFIVMPSILYFGFKLQKRKQFKCMLGVNIFSFFSALLTVLVCMWTGTVSAEKEVTEALSQAASLGLLAASLSTGLACVGAGVAVAAASSAALGAISEDSSIMGKSLIFVALAEGIALYGLLISFMILGKI